MDNRESSSARWTRIIEAHRASGLSIAEFCRRRSVSPPSFFDWRRRLSAAGGASGPAPAFVEVKVGPRDTPPSEVRGTALELILRSGLRVRRGFDRELLCELLAALQPPDSPEASG